MRQWRAKSEKLEQECNDLSKQLTHVLYNNQKSDEQKVSVRRAVCFLVGSRGKRVMRAVCFLVGSRGKSARGYFRAD